MKRISLGILLWLFVSTPGEGIVINEIMYHPKGHDEASYEWLELYNDYAVPLDIGGWFFSEGISFTFPRGTVIRGYSYLVICADKTVIGGTYDIPDDKLAGPFEGRLSNAGERISLVNKYGAVMAHVRYRDREPWPAGADGTGHSLALIDPDLENDESESWAVSPQPLGSPGEPNGFKTETTITDTVLLDVGEEWKHFQGTEPRETRGYGDDDDAFHCRLQIADCGIPSAGAQSEIRNPKSEISGVTPMPVVINEFLANPPPSTADCGLQIAECRRGNFDGITGWPGSNPVYPVILSKKSEIRNPKSEISPDDTFVELFNNSPSPVDVGLTYLSDDPDNLTKYRIPESTVLEPWSCVAFTGTQMGFQLPGGDGAIYFTTSDEERIIDAYAYGATLPGISRGRYPDGEEQWYNMLTPTQGEANQVSVNASIVINEIMYHPYETEEDLEYIELYNRGSESADMSGWSFSEGVDFTFPPGTVLGPDEYLVVAKDCEAIAEKYEITNVIGDYSGNLDNERERIELVDFLGNVVDEVRYAGGEPWPIWAAGWGSSLELIDPRQDNRAALAWAASDDRDKAVWTRVRYTGQFKGGESEFHFFLMHRGECLIDDISMRHGLQEYISNGSFESGTGGWKIEGNHIQSRTYTQETHGGSRCLKIVATGRGDTCANRIECDTASALSYNETYTVSFWVKWQRGINLIYTRTHSQGVAKATRFAMPDARGTPGRRNSVYSTKIGPVIWEVSQNPIVPKSSDPVTVRARISDSDGVVSATLYYKGDDDSSFDSVEMYDDGLHGDRRAGDGLYVGEIPARGSRDLMEFYIVAVDSVSSSKRFPGKEGTFCLYQIEDSPPSTKLPIYRFLLTRQVDQRLRSRNRFSNELEDCTFVLNDTQIYYNCGIRTRGSGWTRVNHPTNQYRFRFPADRPLRGVQREINLDANRNQDGTQQHDRTVHHLLRELGGVPTSYHRYVHVRFNGSYRMLAEDTLKVDGDFARLYWPEDAQGTLFKVDDHFEWTDGWSHSHWDAYLRWEGADKEEYRWNWELRTNEKEDDYSDFLEFVRFMDSYQTSNTTFDAQAEDVLDVDEWMKILCVRFLVDDWDTLGYDRGKNAYIYKPYHKGDGTPDDPPRHGKWMLIPWDSDLTFSNANAPIVASKFPSIRRMLERPRFQRRYYSYYLALIDSRNGAFSRSNIDEVLDRNYQALAGEQGRPSNPNGMKNFITNRIAVIRSLVPSQPKFMLTTKPEVVDEPQVTLEGTSPFTARTMMVSVNDGPAEPFDPFWTDVKHWRATFQVEAGENSLRFTALDWEDKIVGLQTIVITRRLSPTTDSDKDGLYDREEVEVYHTDYQNPDTDGDGLSDGNEVHLYLTDPTEEDTDEDGLNDGDEVKVYFTSPRSADTDSDTLPDGWEVENNLDPNAGDGDNGGSGDPDGDELPNSDEYDNGTDPHNPDTDEDGMSDSWEIEWGLDPKVGTGEDGPDEDPDGDGSTNIEEMVAGTDPRSAASVFAIISVTSNPPSITISWTTVADKHYRVLAADVPEGPWTAIAEGQVGTGQPQSFADEEAGPNGKRFYKVEVY